MKKDGNYLYRVLALHLFEDEELHQNIRKNIVQYTVENWIENVDLLNSTCVGRTYKNAADYENIMSKIKEYGTDYELGVFVTLNKVDIHVYQIIDKKIELKMPLRYHQKSVGELHITFSGNERSGHWMMLRMVENKSNFQLENSIQKEGLTNLQVENVVEEIEAIKYMNKPLTIDICIEEDEEPPTPQTDEHDERKVDDQISRGKDEKVECVNENINFIELNIDPDDNKDLTSPILLKI